MNDNFDPCPRVHHCCIFSNTPSLVSCITINRTAVHALAVGRSCRTTRDAHVFIGARYLLPQRRPVIDEPTSELLVHKTGRAKLGPGRSASPCPSQVKRHRLRPNLGRLGRTIRKFKNFKNIFVPTVVAAVTKLSREIRNDGGDSEGAYLCAVLAVPSSSPQPRSNNNYTTSVAFTSAAVVAIEAPVSERGRSAGRPFHNVVISSCTACTHVYRLTRCSRARDRESVSGKERKHPFALVFSGVTCSWPEEELVVINPTHTHTVHCRKRTLLLL